MVDHITLGDAKGEPVVEGVTAAQVLHGERLHAQHVRLDPDGEVDTHSHPHEQITFATVGTTVMVIDGEEHELSAGDAVHIPGAVRHSARNETDEATELVDVFSPPREDLLE